MNLFPTFRFGDIDLTEAPFAIAFGHDRGTPEQVVTEVQSTLRDGSLTQVTKYDNREVTLQVLVQGSDLLEIAEAEALLVAEALKSRNEFTFNPGDGFCPDSVFDTYEANLTPEYDDNYDLNLVRLYTLTFDAHPWPRSADLVVTPALAPSTTTTVDDGSSTANWDALGPGVLSSSGGAVISTYDPRVVSVFGGSGTALQRNAVIDTSVEKYIAITWKSSIAAYHAFRQPTGGNLNELRREPAAGGYTRSWYKVSKATNSVPAIYFDVLHPLSALTSATLSISHVETAESLPISGSARQLSRAVTPGGSVPAEGSVIVENTTSELEQVIIYSHPSGGGYSPPLRPWLYYSDTVTTSADLVSGAFHGLAGSCGFRVPVSALPEGDVQLWARVRASVAATHQILWTASAYMNDAVVGDTQEGAKLVNFPAIGQWVLAPLGRLTLPTSPIGPAGFHRITLQQAPGTVGDVQVDEAWLFAMDRGKLTAIDFPLGGTGANRIKVSAPSMTVPNGRIAAAYLPDFSDAYTPSAAAVLCDQTGHRFDPAGSVIFTVTSGTSDAMVSLEHHPRWHTNASA